jgi:hypothetical protein
VIDVASVKQLQAAASAELDPLQKQLTVVSVNSWRRRGTHGGGEEFMENPWRNRGDLLLRVETQANSAVGRISISEPLQKQLTGVMRVNSRRWRGIHGGGEEFMEKSWRRRGIHGELTEGQKDPLLRVKTQANLAVGQVNIRESL